MKCLFCNDRKIVKKPKNENETLLNSDITLGYTVPCPKCQKDKYNKHYKDQGIRV